MMGSDFLTRLVTPSPIMHWLLVLLPVSVAITGLFGAVERGANNRRLALFAVALAVWLLVPVQFADPMAARISAMGSILAWAGLVGFWARHIWDYLPSPVWAHGVVITHLIALLVACVVALVRALLSG
jgi:hypothetical protein